MLRSYPDQLKDMAKTANVDLKDAFTHAGVPNSTYYRSVTGSRCMSFETARKIAVAIASLSADAASL